MCRVQKYTQTGSEPTFKCPERLLRTPGLSKTSTQVWHSAAFLSLQVLFQVWMPHKKGDLQVGTAFPASSNSFISQRICLHSDTHRQSHCKGSCDHTADSFFVHAPGEEIVQTAKAHRTKSERKESISM